MQKILSSILFLTFFTTAYAQDSTLVNFKSAVQKHVSALEQKNLPDLIATVDDSATLIFPDGEMYHSLEKYIQFHSAWFKKNWEIKAQIVESEESAELGYALIKYTYLTNNPRKTDNDATSTFMMLVFKKRKNIWLLVHEQNTKISKNSRSVP